MGGSGDDSPNGAALFEAANKLRGSVESAEYKHLVLGLIFLKYVSDSFALRREQLEAELSDPASDGYLDDPTDTVRGTFTVYPTGTDLPAIAGDGSALARLENAVSTALKVLGINAPLGEKCSCVLPGHGPDRHPSAALHRGPDGIWRTWTFTARATRSHSRWRRSELRLRRGGSCS